MKLSFALSTVLILFTSGVWAKEACDDDDFRKKYKSYCEGKVSLLDPYVINEDSIDICRSVWKNKPEFKEYCANQKMKSYVSNSSKKKTPKGRRVTRKEIEKIEKRWKKDYANNKAIAAGSSKNGKVTGYICYEHSSLSSAMRCALKGCEAQGNACAIIVENNDTVDLKVAKENLEIARNNRSNSSSNTQSQSSSSLVDECLKRMEKAREKVVTSCSFSARTKQSGLSGALAVIGACKERARTQFPDVACYGAGLPPRLPPVGIIDPPSSSPDSTYEYVMTIESGFCPQTVRRPHIYMLDRSQRSGTKTICYYK